MLATHSGRVLACIVFGAGLAGAQTNPVPVLEPTSAPSGLTWDGGGDVRLQEEIYDNIPGILGGENANYLRVRSRIWGEVRNEDFRLYSRLANEFHKYFEPSSCRDYRAPDELFVDNLYLDLLNLFNDRVDLRIGRQDLLGPQGPMYGAGRVLCDGTPFDTSRTVFMDAIKATVKFDEKNALDILAIYNSPENPMSWGHAYDRAGNELRERQLTAINPGSTELTEYGGGLYFKSKEFSEFPFELYYLYKRETKARLPGGLRIPGRHVHTWGTRVMPKLTETLSAELEGALQAGEKDGDVACSGYMGYTGLTYTPLLEGEAKPFVTGAFYYLSGDKSRGDGEADAAWDPLWSRWPQISELYVYNFMYGAGYWSNLMYPHAKTGVGLGPGHCVSGSVGPMYVAVEDDLGGGSGNLYGWLGSLRYDFPLLKNVFGKRGDLFGHVVGEVLDPGDYYTSDQIAFFARWEISAQF